MFRPVLLSITVFLMTLATVFSCGSGSQTADLKLGLKEGKVYRTRTITDQNTRQSMMGREIQSKVKTTHDLAFEVTGTDPDGNLVMKVTFERIAMENEGMGQHMACDSDEPETMDAHPMGKGLAAMVGKSYTIVISERGELASVSGMDSIVNLMVDNMEVADERQREMYKQQFSSAFGEQQSEQMCNQMFGMIPPGPVDIGEKWTCSSSTTALVPMSWDQTWRLKEIKGDRYVIEGEAVTSIHTGEEPVEMGPVKIQMDMDGTQSGTMELDAETGLVVGGTINITMTGEQTITDGVPEQLLGKAIPMEMQQTVTWQEL